MGVFEFIIVLVLISTVGKVLSDRRDDRALANAPVRADAGEIEGLRAAVDDMSMRLALLEEERDFYRDLLEAPEEAPGLPAGDDSEPSGRHG